MSGRSPPCGIPLQRFTRYFGIADVGLGAISVAVMGLYLSLNEAHKVKESCTTMHCRRTIPPWLALVVLVAAAVQCVMGFVLIIGAVQKSRGICIFWLIPNTVTSLLHGYFPLRLFELYVVHRFIQELKEEQQVGQSKGNPNPNADPRGIQHNPAVLIQQYPPGIGLQKSNPNMWASPNATAPIVSNTIGGRTVVGEREPYGLLFSHQQNQSLMSGAKLNEIQLDGKGKGSLLTPQLSKNSGSQKMDASTQQPPPKYSYN